MRAIISVVITLWLAHPCAAQYWGSRNARKITGVPVTAPVAGDDGKCLSYNHTLREAIWLAIAPADHALLSATHGDTVAAAVQRGDLIAGLGATPKWSRLGGGSAGYVLTMGTDEPAWAAPVAVSHSLLSATHGDTTAAPVQRGDLIVGQGATPTWARLGKGTTGQVLTMGTDEPSWATLPAEVDGVIGNEVVDTADATLTRSGTGTGADPYKLALNLANANTWTGLQTLSNGTTSAGRIRFLEDGDNGTQSATLYGPASLDSDISVTLPSEAGTLALRTGTSTLTVNKPDIRTTLTDGLVLANTTPATSGVPMQYSPALRLEGHVWASGAGSDDKWEWYQYIQPEAGPSTSSWATFVSSKNGGPLNTAFQFSSTGILIASALRISNLALASNGAAMSSASTYSWSATSSFSHAKDLSIGRNSPNVLGITRGDAAGAGSITARNYMVPLVADATVQYGQVVMPSASTDGRFVAATKDDTLAIGVFSGLGPSASGTEYNIVLTGIAHVVLAEDQAVTRGQYLCIDASTAGYAAPSSSSLCAQGKGIGKALYSEPVSYTIDPAGCGGSCVNTSTETITLASAPGWAVDDPVVYWASGGSAIGGLMSGYVYWIHSITGADVTLKATKDGTTKVDLTSAGDDSTQYLQRLPQAIVNIQ